MRACLYGLCVSDAFVLVLATPVLLVLYDLSTTDSTPPPPLFGFSFSLVPFPFRLFFLFAFALVFVW